jgi:NDP-sugar pyrophosphorylase family protein
MYGDDIYAAEDMQKCLEYDDWVVLVQKRESVGSAAKVTLDEDGLVKDIIEADSHDGGSGLANVALYLIDERIFDYPPVRVPGRKELGLPQTMVRAVRNVPLHPVEASFFIAITAPEDLARGEEALAVRKK